MMRLLVLFLLLTASVANAQLSETSWVISTVTSSATSANEAMIQQAGASNQATLAILAGSANRLDINQMANGNSATVQVTGRANGLQLTQTGSGNVLDLGLQGNNNALLINQQGGDVARMSGLTSSNAKIELIQGGGNNTLITDGPLTTGAGATNLRIEQNGGATARIQYGRSF